MQDPIIKILIGNDTFLLGKDIIDLDFQIGEGKKQNNISFTIHDRDGFYADKYISTSYAQGGIDLPIDFLEDPTEAKDTNSASSATEIDSGGNGTVSRGGVFTPRIRAFLDTIASKETAPGTALSIDGYRSVSGSTTLFNESEMVAGGFPRSQGNKNIGRYQFVVVDYNHARTKYPSINNYSPQNQDLLAYFKLQHRNVLPYLLRDDLDNAIDKASYEWASFPGIGKPQGQFNQVQSGTTIASLKSYYETRLSYYRSLEAETDIQASTPKDTTNNQYEGKEYKTIKTLNNSTTASFYGYNDGFAGRKTANGETFNPELLTAAHESLPFGTLVKVTWLTNSKSVVVRINDRGAFVRLGRQIDLSYGAAKALSSPLNDAIATGLLNVKLEIVELRTPADTNLKESAKKQIAENLEKIKKNQKELPTPEISAKGTQITLEVSIDRTAIAVFSFLHTGTKHNAIIGDVTSFTGQSVNWVLNRRVKNTRYTGVTLKGLASNITRQYGLELDMSEEGDTIENVSQVSQTDWQFLEKMTSIQGFGMRTVGKVLQIYKITVNAKKLNYTIRVGENVKSLTVIDQAQTDATGSSQKIEHYGGRMTTVVDADSGSLLKIDTDNKRNAGDNQRTFTTGVDVPQPQIQKQYTNPRPEGASVKEFQIQIELYTTQQDLENLTPDTALYIENTLPFIVGKSWFIESVKHNFSEGVFTSQISAYIPVAPKAIASDSGEQNSVTFDNSQSVISQGVGKLPAYKILSYRSGRTTKEITSLQQSYEHWRGTGGYTAYKQLSGFNSPVSYMKGRPNQLVYDFILQQNGSQSCPVPSPVSGRVVATGGSNGMVKIETPDGGEVRLLHMSNIRVKNGQNVVRGTILGTQASVGGTSTGTHLHIEANQFILETYVQSLISGNW
ncbi:valine-glycine repeat protein G1 [Nostoc phage YongM]|nr:valine-glycine repeat protein G1 [Nostoc phage YongM]